MKLFYFIFSSYIILLPTLLKVDYDNRVSVFVAATAPESLTVKFHLIVNQKPIESKITCKAGKILFS